MRTVPLLLFLFCISSGAFAQSIDADSLVERDGINFRIDTDIPYTGTAITHNEDGGKLSEITFLAGIPKGKLTSWYPDGKKQVEGELQGTTKVGLWKAWYPNGKLRRQGVYKDDKEEGKFTWYFEDGALSKEGNYRAGVENGKWVWYHENGRRMQEGTLEGETSVGTWKEWYPNGKPKMVGSFVAGEKQGKWTWWDENGKKIVKTYSAGTIANASDSVDLYVERMSECLEKRDMNGALANVDRAFLQLKDHTEKEPRYMWLSIFKSKVYSLFQHIDQAQGVLLEAAGIPTEDVQTIVLAHDSTSFPALRELASRMMDYPDMDKRIAPHVALALVYNILQDSIAMRDQQQWMMDSASDDAKDWVIKMSLTLYGLQADKELAYHRLAQARKDVIEEGETRENQHLLAVYLTDLAKYDEAIPIVDKYLALDPDDLDFIIIKLNIAMGTGDLPAVQRYREEALRIDPKALEE